MYKYWEDSADIIADALCTAGVEQTGTGRFQADWTGACHASSGKSKTGAIHISDTATGTLAWCHSCGASAWKAIHELLQWKSEYSGGNYSAEINYAPIKLRVDQDKCYICGSKTFLGMAHLACIKGEN